MKNLAVLGATGSIGRSTLNLVRNDPEEFNVFSLVAYTELYFTDILWPDFEVF